jgi:hypothetical protein
MTLLANVDQGGGSNLPPANSPSPPREGRPWSMDEIVVAAFAFLGFGGAVFLPLRFGFASVPPIVVFFSSRDRTGRSDI